MKKLSKCTRKILSVLLTTLMVLAIFTVAPISASAKTTLDVLRSKYPHGSYWNGSYNGRAWQCHGFALQLGYELTDSDPYGWATYENNNITNYIANGNLKPGDIIRTWGNGHTIMVTNVNGSAFNFVDCNFISSNTVRWDGYCTISNNNYLSTFGAITYIKSSPTNVVTQFNPTGAVDSITGGTNSVKISGWAFDKDDVSKALQIHVYIGNEGHVVTADKYRPDVNSAHHSGDYHGYEATLFTSLTGNQTIQIFAINIGSGGNILLGTSTVNIVKEDTPPNIIRTYISEITKDSFRVCCEATDNIGISRVAIATWTAGNGQDDLIWHDANFNGYSTYFIDVNRSDYTAGELMYYNHIYVYDISGNHSVAVQNIEYELNKPKISNVTVSSVSEKGYRITCNVSDDSEISHVRFPTWTPNNGQDDLIWYDGVLNGNVATCYIPTSKHNNETGLFVTHIYVYDGYGNEESGGISVNVSSKPVEVSTKNLNSKKYTLLNSGCTWEEAKKWCEKNGGHLATITSQEEWDNVKTLLADFNYTYCWLGAECTSGEWKWVTGEKFSYSDWCKGEPNCANNNEFYLATYGSTLFSGKQWNDFSLEDSTIGGFVCEYEPLLGDINSDWKITLEDLILVQRYIISTEEITDEAQDITEMSLADMNSDGKITVVDVLMLQRILLSP